MGNGEKTMVRINMGEIRVRLHGEAWERIWDKGTCLELHWIR